MTALPLNGKRRFQHFEFHWIGRGEPEQLTKVNSTLGLSRMMLYLIYSITHEIMVRTPETNGLLNKHPDKRNAEHLLQEIENSPQWVDQSEDDMPRYIALQTAETYRFGTRLYCLARLYGYGSRSCPGTPCLILQRYTPEHPAIRQTCNSLLSSLYDLPTEGPWYSSIHPAWCFVVACICVRGEEDFDILVNHLDRIAGNNKSVSFTEWYMDAVDIFENVDDCCSLVRRTRHWQRQEWENRVVQGQDTGWWERMAESVEGECVICLA